METEQRLQVVCSLDGIVKHEVGPVDGLQAGLEHKLFHKDDPIKVWMEPEGTKHTSFYWERP